MLLIFFPPSSSIISPYWPSLHSSASLHLIHLPIRIAHYQPIKNNRLPRKSERTSQLSEFKRGGGQCRKIGERPAGGQSKWRVCNARLRRPIATATNLHLVSRTGERSANADRLRSRPEQAVSPHQTAAAIQQFDWQFAAAKASRSVQQPAGTESNRFFQVHAMGRRSVHSSLQSARRRPVHLCGEQFLRRGATRYSPLHTRYVSLIRHQLDNAHWYQRCLDNVQFTQLHGSFRGSFKI